MSWGLAAVFSVLMAELLLRAPLSGPLARVRDTSRKALRLVRSRAISDHWKERAMARYALTMAGCTAQLTALLLALAGVGLAFILLADRVVGGFSTFLLRLDVVLFTVLAATGYILVRKIVF